MQIHTEARYEILVTDEHSATECLKFRRKKRYRKTWTGFMWLRLGMCRAFVTTVMKLGSIKFGRFLD